MEGSIHAEQEQETTRYDEDVNPGDYGSKMTESVVELPTGRYIPRNVVLIEGGIFALCGFAAVATTDQATLGYQIAAWMLLGLGAVASGLALVIPGRRRTEAPRTLKDESRQRRYQFASVVALIPGLVVLLLVQSSDSQTIEALRFLGPASVGAAGVLFAIGGARRTG